MHANARRSVDKGLSASTHDFPVANDTPGALKQQRNVHRLRLLESKGRIRGQPLIEFFLGHRAPFPHTHSVGAGLVGKPSLLTTGE